MVAKVQTGLILFHKSPREAICSSHTSEKSQLDIFLQMSGPEARETVSAAQPVSYTPGSLSALVGLANTDSNTRAESEGPREAAGRCAPRGFVNEAIWKRQVSLWGGVWHPGSH